MINFENNITNASREYSLTADERAKMSRTIRSYMAMKPVRAHETATMSSLRWFIYLHRPIAAALILVLVTSTGVSYAAENALPGDALYAVKTYVNEPMKVALATSAEAKADAHIEIAERRIEEAASLAAEGRLDQETGSELAAAFESSAQAAHESIDEAKTEDADASLELTTRFENRLAAHEAVLAEVVAANQFDIDETAVITDAIHVATLAIADTHDTAAPAAALMVATNVASDSAPADEPVATTMAMSISAKAPEARTMKSHEDAQPEATATARAAVTTESAPAPSEKAVTRMQASADKRLKAAQKALAQSSSLSDDVRANFEADLSIAADMLNTGNDQFKNDARADALASFQSSLQISEQTLVRIKAAPTLEKARSRAREAQSSNTSRKNSDRHRVEISAPTVSATVTAPIPVPINVKVDTHEDSHIEDEHEGGDDSGNASSPKVEVKGSLKLDLSL